MSKKTIRIATFTATCSLILLLVAVAARGHRNAGPGQAARRPDPLETKQAFRPVRDPGASSPAEDPGDPAISNRLQQLEERARELEAQRERLAAENKDLERQVAKKRAEESARTAAKERAKSWILLFGVSEAQSREFEALFATWGVEDAQGPAGQETWLARESELRSRLTLVQAAKLHESAVAEAQMHWTWMGVSLGCRVGVPRDQQPTLQQSIGEFGYPQNMLLPEAYGADYSGLVREAAYRLRPSLTPDQTARLESLGLK